VSISQLIGVLEEAAGGVSAGGGQAREEASPYSTLARHLRRVANVQVRNCASWAGNLVLARTWPAFPSDVAAILAAAGATLKLSDANGSFTTHSVESFLVSGRANDALVVSLHLPNLNPPAGHRALFTTFKTGARHVNSAAIVNAGFSLIMDSDTGTVSSARVFFNGLASRIMRAAAVEKALEGYQLSQEALSAAVGALDADVSAAGGPSSDAHHSAAYRLSLSRSYLYKMFLQGQEQLPAELRSALVAFVAAEDRPVSEGSQLFNGGDPSLYPISKAIPKLSARIQASGEAAFASTLPSPASAMHGCMVYSTAAAAKLLAIDPSPALAMPGVVGFVGKEDIPGVNFLSSPEEPLFFAAGQTMPTVGAALGFVVAKTAAEARAAAKAVRQVYDPKPAGHRPLRDVAVHNLEEARRQNTAVHQTDTASALRHLVAKGAHIRRGLSDALRDPKPFSLACGNAAAAIARHRAQPETNGGCVSGSVTTGQQRHFYMETQACLVIPQEDDCLEVWSSTQDPCLVQEVISEVLGRPQHCVTVKVRRVGGGFGGKLTRCLMMAAACAVASAKFRVPVRGQNERLDDLVMTGGREEIIADYTAVFTEDGTVTALQMDMSCDVGWYSGEAVGDLYMGIAFADNAYFTENFSCNGQPFLTSHPANTAMRAPGVIQTILSHEAAMEHVAKVLGMPREAVQERNFYKPGQKSPDGTVIGSATHNWTIPSMWQRMKAKVDYAKRKGAVADFNAGNRWRKRGIAMTPVRYGCGSAGWKSGALVTIYRDGTVLINHGGCELGQGINTKTAQSAAYTLGIAMEKIKIKDTDTSKVPFNTCTGGSMTSECSVKAVEDACLRLKDSLTLYLEGGATWEQAVNQAFADGVCMAATGWWRNPVEGTEYSSCGVACSEVEVDVLSGEVQILQTDILMDFGTALNPAVDIGQLEGAFVMSLGYVLTEEVLFASDGQPLNIGTWHYKIPSAHDIPLKFNVELLDRPNPSGVFKSKATAEPPMSLVTSVYIAVKEAIYSARVHSGETGWFPLGTPVTVQAIQQACLVDPSQFAVQ